MQIHERHSSGMVGRIVFPPPAVVVTKAKVLAASSGGGEREHCSLSLWLSLFLFRDQWGFCSL